jgi:5-methylcytosine-specific restriction endonuclease McrA
VSSCSTTCRRQATNRRKHLRRRGLRGAETISLLAIHRRDCGLCGLCRRPVGLRFTPPHPRAATLDHIVPLIAGGAHEARNVQLAHYGCNSAKRDRARGEQLRLLG